MPNCLVVTAAVAIAAASAVLYPRVALLSAYYGSNDHAGYAALNTAGCKHVTAPQMTGCESAALHEASGSTFLSCGDYSRRQQWWPPHSLYGVEVQDEGHQDPVFRYDADTGKATRLRFHGLKGEFVGHSISVFPRTEHVLSVAIVNHSRYGSKVELFDHLLGSDVLEWRRSVEKPLAIRTPNTLKLIGPEEFYISNDHFFTPRPFRWVEDVLMMAAGDIVYYAGDEDFRVVASDIRHPAGIAVSDDGSKVYVAEHRGLLIREYEVGSRHMLREVDRIQLDTPVDDLQRGSSSGALYATTIPLPGQLREAIMEAGRISSTPATASPFRTLRIANNTGEGAYFGVRYATETIMQDDGTRMVAVTSSIPDEGRKQMILSGVAMEGLFVCPLPKVE